MCVIQIQQETKIFRNSYGSQFSIQKNINNKYKIIKTKRKEINKNE